jgi:hypothetical protein
MSGFSRFKSFISSKIDQYTDQAPPPTPLASPDSTTVEFGPNKADLAKVSLIQITPRIYLFQPSLTPSLSIVASQALSSVSDALFSTLNTQTGGIYDQNNQHNGQNRTNPEQDALNTKLQTLSRQSPVISMNLLVAQLRYINSTSITGDETRSLLINTSENQPLITPKLSHAAHARDQLDLIQSQSLIRLSTPNVPIIPLKTLYTVLYSVLKWLSTETGPIIIYPNNVPYTAPDLTRSLLLISAMLPFIRELISPPHIEAQKFQRELNMENANNNDDKSSTSSKGLAVYENLKKKGPIECYKTLLHKLMPNASQTAVKQAGLLLCPSQLRVLNYMAAIWKGRFPNIIRGLSINMEVNVQNDFYSKKISYLYSQTSNVIIIDKIIVNGIPIMKQPQVMNHNNNNGIDAEEKNCRPFLQIYQIIDPENTINIPFLSLGPNSIGKIPSHVEMVHSLGLDKPHVPFELTSSDDDNDEGVENGEEDDEKNKVKKIKKNKFVEKPLNINEVYLNSSDLESAYLLTNEQNEDINNINIKCELISTSVPIIDRNIDTNNTSSPKMIDQNDLNNENNLQNDNSQNDEKNAEKNAEKSYYPPTQTIGPYTLTPKPILPHQHHFVADRTASLRGVTTIPQYPATQTTQTTQETPLSPSPTSDTQFVWSQAQFDLISNESPHFDGDFVRKASALYEGNIPQKSQPQWISRNNQQFMLFPLQIPARGHIMLRLMHIQSQNERTCIGRVNLFCGFLSPGLIRLTPKDIDDCHPDIQNVDLVIRAMGEPLDINVIEKNKKSNFQHFDDQNDDQNNKNDDFSSQKKQEHELPPNFPPELHIQSIYHTETWDNIGTEQNQLDIGYLSQKHAQIKKVIAENQEKLHLKYLAQQRKAEEDRIKKIELMKKQAHEAAVKQQEAQKEWERGQEKRLAEQKQRELNQKEQQHIQHVQQGGQKAQTQSTTGGWRSMFSNFVSSVGEQTSQKKPEQKAPPMQQLEDIKHIPAPEAQKVVKNDDEVSSDDELEIVFSTKTPISPRIPPSTQPSQVITTPIKSPQHGEHGQVGQIPTSPVQAETVNDLLSMFEAEDAGNGYNNNNNTQNGANNNNNNDNNFKINDDDDDDDDDDFLFNPEGHEIIDDNMNTEDLLKQLQIDLGLDGGDIDGNTADFLFDLDDNGDGEDLNFTSPKISKIKFEEPKNEEKYDTNPENIPISTDFDIFDSFDSPTSNDAAQNTSVDDKALIIDPVLSPSPSMEPSTPVPATPTTQDDAGDDIDVEQGDVESTDTAAPKKKTKTVVKKVIKKVRVKKTGDTAAPADE